MPPRRRSRGSTPPVALRRLRLRQAGGRTFADVVIGVSPGAAVGQGHAAADRVEAAVQTALPDADVVVHVEPMGDEAALRERVHAAAMGVSHVREVHNLALIDTGEGVEVSLHLKLPGDLRIDEAHEIADHVERVISDAAPEIAAVQTHIEPLAEQSAGAEVDLDAADIEQIVRELTGGRPTGLRFLHTEEGLVVFLTLAIADDATLAEAHRRASEVEVADSRGAPRDRRDHRPHRTPDCRQPVESVSMKLCMFHPEDRPMDRGWVGRLDGERVVHLAAQTLQHFFTGGGGAREHAEYARDEVTLLVPVLQPPTVRIFEDQDTFAFGNPTAVLGPGADVPRVDSHLAVTARLVGVVGAEGAIGGFSALLEWRGGGAGAKANDFGLVVGPVVETDVDPAAVAMVLRWVGATEVAGSSARADGAAFDWEAARMLAARGTALRHRRPARRPAGLRARRHHRGRRRGGGRRDRPAAVCARVRLVLDWDGTVTERDTLHMVIEQFGDPKIFTAMEVALGRRAPLAEVIAAEMADDRRSARRGRRLARRERADQARVRRHRRRSQPARRLRGLPRADRADPPPRGDRGRTSSPTGSNRGPTGGWRDSGPDATARCAASRASGTRSRGSCPSSTSATASPIGASRSSPTGSSPAPVSLATSRPRACRSNPSRTSSGSPLHSRGDVAT